MPFLSPAAAAGTIYSEITPFLTLIFDHHYTSFAQWVITSLVNRRPIITKKKSKMLQRHFKNTKYKSIYCTIFQLYYTFGCQYGGGEWREAISLHCAINWYWLFFFFSFYPFRWYYYAVAAGRIESKQPATRIVFYETRRNATKTRQSTRCHK